VITIIIVRYETSQGIYGPIGQRRVRIPRYVQGNIWQYLCLWLKRNVSAIAKPLEYWKE